MDHYLLKEAYGYAKSVVRSSGYDEEIHWQQNIQAEKVTESDFLRECAWVIFCSGFSERILRRKFPYLSICFCDWESASDIVKSSKYCRANALQWFKNAPKVDAVLEIASIVANQGFESIRSKIISNTILFLQGLPFIGVVTSWHLAKNLGLPVAKPDRHLMRIAKATGFADALSICAHLSEKTGDTIPVVDLVLWRYATIEKRYLDTFKGSCALN